MKWIVRIALIISIAVNGYFIFDEKRFQRNQEFGRMLTSGMGGELNKTSWKLGLEILRSKLKDRNQSLLNKKYYYINIWTNWCIPCVREMPWLDSIACKLDKDVGYIFVSDISDSTANKCLKKRNYQLKQFVFLNNGNDFVSALCNKMGTKSKMYPTVIILNNKAELLHYSHGAYGNEREAAGFAEMINRLQ